MDYRSGQPSTKTKCVNRFQQLFLSQLILHHDPFDNTRMVASFDLKQNPTLVWIFEITGPSQFVADELPDFKSFLSRACHGL